MPCARCLPGSNCWMPLSLIPQRLRLPPHRPAPRCRTAPSPHPSQVTRGAPARAAAPLDRGDRPAGRHPAAARGLHRPVERAAAGREGSAGQRHAGRRRRRRQALLDLPRALLLEPADRSLTQGDNLTRRAARLGIGINPQFGAAPGGKICADYLPAPMETNGLTLTIAGPSQANLERAQAALGGLAGDVRARRLRHVLHQPQQHHVPGGVGRQEHPVHRRRAWR